MSDAGTVRSATGRSWRHGEGARRRQAGRRLAAAMSLAAASIAFIAAPAAVAAAPEVNRFHDVGTEVDPDFCGTGVSIDIAFDIRGIEWLAPHNADYRNVARGEVAFTNPLTGAVVINSFAGPYVERLISGDPEGIHVVESSFIGLPQTIKTPHGGVLTRDAGYITLRETFDGEEFVDQEVVINRGPHPEADSEFELFCDVVTDALGI
jgi:hypothetical protein